MQPRTRLLQGRQSSSRSVTLQANNLRLDNELAEVSRDKMCQASVNAAVLPETVPSSGGMSKGVKLVLLLVLCLQNAVYTMLRRYSVGVLGEEWSTSSVLMVGEVIKLGISTCLTLAERNNSSTEETRTMKLWRLICSSVPMAVPAVIFWLMNLLSYVSLKRVDATTFAVLSQMKILTTAVFSVILMGRTFHARKWRALVLLVIGVTLVSSSSNVPAEGENDEEVNMQYLIGVSTALAQVILSGFVSVYFEKVLKSEVGDLSLWDRNVQLATFSIAFYLPVALRDDGAFFEGWTMNAIFLAVLSSAGGLLVAVIVKYTDSVLKTFATSGAIIVTAISGHFLLDAPLDVPAGLGVACTVLSLLNYGDSGTPENTGGAKESSPATARVPVGVGTEAHPIEECTEPLMRDKC